MELARIVAKDKFARLSSFRNIFNLALFRRRYFGRRCRFVSALFSFRAKMRQSHANWYYSLLSERTCVPSPFLPVFFYGRLPEGIPVPLYRHLRDSPDRFFN